VRLVRGGAGDAGCSGGDDGTTARCVGGGDAASGGGAVVAFMDIRCASRAHDSLNVLAGTTLLTAYNESSTTPAPVTAPPPPPPPAAADSATPPPCRAPHDAARARRSPTLTCHRRPDGYDLILHDTPRQRLIVPSAVSFSSL